MLTTVDGLVLRTQDWGENDRLLTILTAEGRMTVIAKGARSMKSKIQNLTQPFVYANFELNQRDKGISWIKGGSVEFSFYELRNELEEFFLASYVCDVANELSDERTDCSEILRLSLNTLFAITKKIRPLMQIKAVFEIRAAAISGYRPDLSCCEDCGEEDMKSSCFDVMNGAVVCSECLSKRGQEIKRAPNFYDDIRERTVIFPLNSATLAALRFALRSPNEKMLSFNMTEKDDLALFSKACEGYLLHHLGHGFSSLDLFYSIL